MAFQAGLPLELIKILVDWKSNAVLLYLTVPPDIRLQATTLLTISNTTLYLGLADYYNIVQIIDYVVIAVYCCLVTRFCPKVLSSESLFFFENQEKHKYELLEEY